MIKIQTEETEHGHKYINIYEVRAMNHELKTKTVEIFLNKKKAKEYAKFIENNYKNLYIKAWTNEQIVWC